MAVETINRYFSHGPRLTGDKLVALLSAIDSDDDEEPVKVRNYGPPFFHNDLHDLESLWWVGIWVLFFNIDISDLDTRIDDRDIQWRAAVSGLFPGTEDTSDRREFLEKMAIFERRTAWMSSRLRKVKKSFKYLGGWLLLKYLELEAHFPAIKMELLEGTHATFCTYLERARNSAGGIELVPYNGRTLHQSSSTVRKPEEGLAQATGYRAACDVHEPRFTGLNATVTNAAQIPCKTPALPELKKRQKSDDDFLTPVPVLRTAR